LKLIRFSIYLLELSTLIPNTNPLIIMSLEVIDIARISDGASSKPQIQARVDLFKTWGIPSGSKILEIGCGQGDCTLVMAYLVGEQGHVTGIDPAPLDYGSFVGSKSNHIR
jgi:predicted methyltransferase